MITAVPTQTQIEAAYLAKLDAWTAWAISGDDQEGDRWADYQCAIELHNLLQFQRNQAILKEAGVCSV